MFRSRNFWTAALGPALAAASLALLAPWVAGELRVLGMTQTRTAVDLAARALRDSARLSFTGEDQASPGLRDQERSRALGALVHGARKPVRLTLIAADGEVLADGLTAEGALTNHFDRPEFQAALRTGHGEATRFSSTLGERCHYQAWAEPGPAPSQPLFVARASLSVEPIHASAARLRNLLWTAALVLLALGLWMGVRAERRAERARGERARTAAALESTAAELDVRLRDLTADRNKLRAILASLVEGVVAVDRMDRVVHLNAVGARLLGIERDGAEGSRLWELTRAMEVCSILERARREVREVRGETRLLAATPQERVIELWASPLKDREGAVAGSLVVLHDVTQLRKLESLRRDFVANVSHELKTPLTAIRGLVETLLDDPAMESETRRHFLERVRAQAGRLGQLVNDLLTLARVESAEGLPQRERVDVRVVLQECAARFEPLCAAKDLRLVRDLGTRSLIVLGDEECLRQIADNLLDNALKYTPAGGRVHLRARASEATPDVVVEVEDSGIGIPSDQLERIFERFYRVDKARSRELGGTGLGLSIVKNMAQALGGSVSVESALGRGSTFRVTLPLQDV